MVGTKSRGYSNSGRLSEGEYSMPFLSSFVTLFTHDLYSYLSFIYDLSMTFDLYSYIFTISAGTS